MIIDEAAIRDLVMWWATRQPPLKDGLLAAEFQYDSEIDMIDLSDFIAEVELQEAWDRVDLVALLVDARYAIVVLDGVDPVTKLEHRIGWFIEHDGGQIKAIRAINALR